MGPPFSVAMPMVALYLWALSLASAELGQYPFGKEKVLSQVGQHFKDMRAVLGKQVVQFLCQWVH